MTDRLWRQRAALPALAPAAVAALAAVLSATLAAPPAGAADGPTIRLFPTTVIEDIRQTGFVAQEMETGLQDVISRLDQQQELFVQSKCDGAENDAGCDQIARQLGDTYMEMLTIMGDLLPDMEHAVNSTRGSLEKRLRTEIGNKMSPWTMQETLLGNRPDGTAKTEPRLRGRSGLRLSERFRQYHNLVAHSSGASDNSLAVVAADIYLDMSEASDLIARTQQEISRATLMGQLNQSFGLITPEMQQVVTGVKSILFGDPEAAAIVAGPPINADDGEYRSPLEM